MAKTRFAQLTDLADAATIAATHVIRVAPENPADAGRLIDVALYAEHERATLTVEQAQQDYWQHLQESINET